MPTTKLHQTFKNLLISLLPAPPPLKIRVEPIETFAIDLKQMVVKAPKYWRKMKHLPELLTHEIKHGSNDGLPYTWNQALRYEAYVMAHSRKPLEVVKWVLNAVYDAVVDLRVQMAGLDAKGMCEEWLQKFPVTKRNEGTIYHLLQIIYKDLFGISLPPSDFERQVKRKREYYWLMDLIRKMAEEGGTIERVSNAALIMLRLARVTKPPSLDVSFSRSSKEVQAEAVEAGLNAGLRGSTLAEFAGVPEEELEKTIQEVADEKVKTALWENILGFKDLFAGRTSTSIRERISRKWRPYSRKVLPESVVKNPDDPRKWREPELKEVLQVEQAGEKGGFSKVILLIDHSGSTMDPYKNQTVLEYIKSAAYGLIAYAKKRKIPLVTVAFSGYAEILANEKNTYVEHGKQIFKLRPAGATNLYRACQILKRVHPEQSLIALITDGLVNPEDIQHLLDYTKANKVVIAVTDSSRQGVKTVQTASEKADLFLICPDELGRVLVKYLDKTYAPLEGKEQAQISKDSSNLKETSFSLKI
ncbi:MAG TPA: VWA domain-containing protein [Thermococcus sp.]|nr:VWA domain-containing protein [Thermococcus sp.]